MGIMITHDDDDGDGEEDGGGGDDGADQSMRHLHLKF